jgi:hypothetical protein
MSTILHTPGEAGPPMLYDARTEAIEARRVKIHKMMARGFTASQMASALGMDLDVAFKDIKSIRSYIANELQGSDAQALIAESLGVFGEIRASALRDLDNATTTRDRSMARRDLVRIEGERMKCIALAVGGVPGRGNVINVTPNIEADPVPQLEDQHQKLMEIAKNLANEVLLVGGDIPDSETESNTEEASP